MHSLAVTCASLLILIPSIIFGVSGRRLEGSCDSTWKASNGKDCETYARRRYCDGHPYHETGYGTGWQSRWGTFEDYADSQGRTALVCRECGCNSVLAAQNNNQQGSILNGR